MTKRDINPDIYSCAYVRDIICILTIATPLPFFPFFVAGCTNACLRRKGSNAQPIAFDSCCCFAPPKCKSQPASQPANQPTK